MFSRLRLFLILLLAANTVVCAEPSFRNDVMAVLSKAGCNSGACHGNANGKGGFKLSLRGEDPESDYRTLTRDFFGRRINRTSSGDSLLLHKPTTQVAHEGGQRFAVDSPEYAILKDWIACGATNDVTSAPRLVSLKVIPPQPLLQEPSNEVSLKVLAHYDNGTQRDVTALAVYEPVDLTVKAAASGLLKIAKPGESTVIVRYLDQQVPVRITFVPDRPGFKWHAARPQNYIDEQVFAKLRTLRVNPSPRCDDSVFVRRAHLDLIGSIPTGDQAKAFAADKRKDKRRRLVQSLLQRDEFADFWALKWADLLRNEEKVLDRKGVQTFHRWMRDSLASNKPVNDFAREILAARGSSYQMPTANFLRALRDPVKRAEATAQVFLGTRLQCAQCHNHPYDRWTQNDYYSWAAAFAPVSYKVLDNQRRDRLDTHEFVGEQIVFASHKPRVNNPRTGKPAEPKFLSVDSADADNVADWLVNTRQFAQAQVNRVWASLIGRGLVEPVDDFRLTNPASHPELLDRLTDDFIQHKYNLRYLIELIMESQTYQLSSDPRAGDDNVHYASAGLRRLTAEQLVDSQHQALGVLQHFSGYPEGLRASQLPGVITTRRRRQNPLSASDQMLKLFGKPERLLTCECERSNETTMSQAFHLIGGSLQELLGKNSNRLEALATVPAHTAVTTLYWEVLSRAPTATELAVMQKHLQASQSPRKGLEDVAWALLNSKEFILRR